MRLMKRWLSGLLCLVLLLGLLPTAALAEGTPHWAQSAVDVLNGIYADGTFSISEQDMTVRDAQTALDNMGASTDKLTGETNSALTRGTACEVLANWVQRSPSALRSLPC